VPDSRARRRAGQLESEVLTALHAADHPLTPAQVQEALGADLAYTTVLTILTRLYAKGLAARVPAGRGFAYSPAEGEATVVARQMHALLAGGRDRAAVLAQFFDGLEPEEEQLLARLLDPPPGTSED
jgi:predicted transcriptional regulator